MSSIREDTPEWWRTPRHRPEYQQYAEVFPGDHETEVFAGMEEGWIQVPVNYVFDLEDLR